MTAHLELERMQELARAFPDPARGWRSIETRYFVADRAGRIHSDWSAGKEWKGAGGVYAILLPTKWFHMGRTMPLHAPHRHRGEQIIFEFTLQSLTESSLGVVYVGRSTALTDRWRGHLSRGKRKDGGQVKFGLMDCRVFDDETKTLRELRANGLIVFTVLPGPENCANRDVLEMSLCARFAPPFNIKSER